MEKNLLREISTFILGIPLFPLVLFITASKRPLIPSVAGGCSSLNRYRLQAVGLRIKWRSCLMICCIFLPNVKRNIGVFSLF